MEHLPNEILQSIFSLLSQKYIATHCSLVCKKWQKILFQPSFYYIVHIYSEQQLKKVIQVATTKTINKKYIGYYVKELNFHFMGSLSNMLKHKEGLKHFATIFPNLKTIYGLLDNEIDKYASVCLYLKQLTHFFYCYPFQPWIAAFNEKKNTLTSLEINITQQLFHLIPQSDNAIIYLQLTNNTMKNDGLINTIIDEYIPTKILILPTLINLTKLKIDFCAHANRLIFCFHNIDERTIENIHQSCPNLESLTLNDFIMSVSDQYYNNNNSKRISPAICLKHIDINGDLTDPLCYTYLSIKYTHLESLSLYISENISIINDNSNHFEKTSQSIYQMIRGFSLLKSINCQTFHHIGPNSSQNNIRGSNITYWPHLLFTEWLNQHPNQLIHLNYPFDLTKNGFNAATRGINNNIIPQYHYSYLNYLTSLSLRTDNAIHLVLNYFLQNTNSTSLPVISANLKELGISSSYTVPNNSGIFIYDWFIVFPKLISLKLNHMFYIYDDDDKNNIEKDNNNYFKYINDNQESIKLHQLIKQRQQKNTLNKKNDTFYKLENLEINESHIYFNNNDGFDSFLRSCQRLKSLVLKNNKIFISTKNKSSISPVTTLPLLSSSTKEKSFTFDQFHFDLSNLYLELLYIKNLLLISGNDFIDKHFVNKLVIYESVSDHKRIIESTNDFYTIETIKNGSPYRSCTLFMDCKFIDGLVFNP